MPDPLPSGSRRRSSSWRARAAGRIRRRRSSGGQTLTELGRYPEALERFATVAELTAASPWGLLGMGKISLLLGDDAAALGAFARLLRGARSATPPSGGREPAARSHCAGIGHKDPERVAEKALKRSRDASS